MEQELNHSENCCSLCATRITEIHTAMQQIANAIGSINLDDLSNSMVGKMLGLGKK